MSSMSMTEYLHFQRQNFLKTRTAIGATINENELSSKIQKHYESLKRKAKYREDKLKALSPVANDMLSLFATTQNISQLLEGKIDAEVDKKIGAGGFDQDLRDAANATAGFYKKIQESSNAVEELNKLLAQMSDILSNLDVINAELLEYCATLPEHQNESVTQSFRPNGKFQILNINATAVSSLESLKSRLESLNNAKNSMGGNFPQTVTYVNSKGETKIASTFGVVYSMRQLLINILGGYGEAMSAIYAMSKADEIITKMASQIPNMTVSGSGTTKLQGQTAKSDVKVTYQDNQVSLSVGVSAKAQLYKSKKSTTTTFQTSKLKIFLAAKGIDEILQYNFLNNIYNGSSSLNEQVVLNRYIAAMNFDNAVTGWNIGDNVMFLSYLDRVISVSDFYKDVAKGGKGKISNYPKLSINGFSAARKEWEGKEENSTLATAEDDTPLDKSTLAWQRSKAMKDLLLSLQTQIQFSH